ncbi:MAG: adenylate/guanylate cyclase domain-containing protein [Pseudomonadota bacterium]|nr:adenylate/guanylate cyclase domain-containing protein [Pseudomonadota bacterium]
MSLFTLPVTGEAEQTPIPANTTAGASLPRRLASILHADIVGFSRLTADDEDTAYHKVHKGMAFVVETIENHDGRVCDQTGDSLLALFSSAADAVAAALTIQQQQRTAHDNVTLVRFRIGVNLGDVIEDGRQAFGHTVNVAARLQALAPAGGVCISEAVRTAIGTALPLKLDSLGDKKLHNIAEPVRAYVIAATPMAAVRSPYRRADPRRGPTVAVLPFAALGTAPADSRPLGDGLSIDIITALSRYRQLFVLAPHTSMALPSSSNDMTGTAHRVGADYLIAGSIEPIGSHLRFSVQLIETRQGAYAWADQFDLDMSQLILARDRVTKRTVATLVGAIEEDHPDSVDDQGTAATYQTLLKSKRLVYRMRDAGDNQIARTLLSSILHADPACAPALAVLALSHLTGVLMSWSRAPAQDLVQGHAAAARALEMDSGDYLAHGVFGITSLWQRRYAAARIHLSQALTLNPNDADTLAGQGLYLTFTGEPQRGAECLRAAVERNPFHPGWYAWACGLAEYNAQQFEAALATLLSIAEPTRFHRRLLAATHAQLGDLTSAGQHCRQVMTEVPAYRITDTVRTQPYQAPEHGTLLTEGLRLAGFPE